MKIPGLSCYLACCLRLPPRSGETRAKGCGSLFHMAA